MNISQFFKHASPSLRQRPLSTIQPFSSNTRYSYPRKGAEDRNSINTDASEYSKSGTDDAAAHQNEAAFDPSQTDPQEQKDTAGKGNDVNPLEVSPANPDVSKQRGSTEGGAEKGPERTASSGRGSPTKGKPVG